jgi:hypothetical protein
MAAKKSVQLSGVVVALSAISSIDAHDPRHAPRGAGG